MPCSVVHCQRPVAAVKTRIITTMVSIARLWIAILIEVAISVTVDVLCTVYFAAVLVAVLVPVTDAVNYDFDDVNSRVRMKEIPLKPN